MKVRIDAQEFLRNIESYAEDTEYDYTYYLISHELRRMQISKMIGKLSLEHMNPILLFLRDWMPSGWVTWSEKGGKRWEMGSKLCTALNKLSSDFNFLRKLDLMNFVPELHGNTIIKIFEQISGLELAVSEEAIATVTSKIIHLLDPKLFVMWDTKIIGYYSLQPNANGYLEFLVEMKKFAKQLQSRLNEINKKAEEFRKKSCELYGEQICSEKSLAKLIDESNWIEVRKRRDSYR